MATSFPYASSGSIAKALVQFKKSFPAIVNANTLKKFAIAPNNESYVISVLRFLGFIDDDGKRVEGNISFFFGDEKAFAPGLEGILRVAYKPLFDDFGDTTLDMQKDELVPWFRATDKSSASVGVRQASTFIGLAGMAGHGAPPNLGNGGTKLAAGQPKAKPAIAKNQKVQELVSDDYRQKPKPQLTSDFGLSVRVEINLPANGDEETYDAIFRSIRRNLIEGHQD